MNVIPTEHAWVVKNGMAHDATWQPQTTAPDHYFGITMSAANLNRAMAQALLLAEGSPVYEGEVLPFLAWKDPEFLAKCLAKPERERE